MDRLQLPSRPIARGIKNTYHARLRCSARADNSLDAANIKTLRELGTKEEKHLLEDNNFVSTSVNEIKEQLAKLGLTLGMSLDDMDEDWDLDTENLSKLLREMKLPTV